MDSDAEMMERHARLLGRYAEQAASLAEDLCAAALAAETAAEKQSLSLAFHRMGRTLRQTLALEAKLRRDARREDRIEQARVAETAKAAVTARKDRIRNAVEYLIWTEIEEPEQLGYLELLNARMESEDLADPEEPVEVLIERVATEIGLSSFMEPVVADGVGAPVAASPVEAGSNPDPLYSDDYWSGSG